MSREQEEYIKKMVSYVTEITNLITGRAAEPNSSTESVKAAVKRAIRIANELTKEMDVLPDKEREMLAGDLENMRSALLAMDAELPPPRTAIDSGIYRKVINSGTLACIDQAIVQNPTTFYPDTDQTGKIIGYHFATVVDQGEGKLKVTLVWRSLPAELEDTDNKNIVTPKASQKPIKIPQEAVGLHLFIRKKYMEKRGRMLEFTIQEYMAARNLKLTPRNRTHTAQDITRACDMLRGIEMRVENPNGWSGCSYLYTGSAYQNNQIRIAMSDELANAFDAAHNQHAWLPLDHMLDIDRERNPNALPIITLLSQNKAMNWRKADHGDIIRMSNIISKIYKLAQYQQVISAYSEYKRYIIDPIERDLNISDKVYSWEYIKGGNTSIEDFVNAEIKIVWKEHPQDSKAFQDDIARQTILSLQKSTTRKVTKSTAKTTRTTRAKK